MNIVCEYLLVLYGVKMCPWAFFILYTLSSFRYSHMATKHFRLVTSIDGFFLVYIYIYISQLNYRIIWYKSHIDKSELLLFSLRLNTRSQLLMNEIEIVHHNIYSDDISPVNSILMSKGKLIKFQIDIY